MHLHVIGTAGHIDHGKSTLVHALTGIDPDRLAEEKRRGMTIELGFAWLRLPSGREASVVDVPGHGRFIRHMLAGAGGVDVALLVVAADEGVMPQTREHLDILDLLGVSCGVVALTKRDLVDDEWLELVREDVRATLAGTSLEGAELVACSATTGAGLDELCAALDAALDAAWPHPDRGRPHLPVDRVFTLAGFGTVVTGTLLEGTLQVGQDVEIAPRGLRARVRGLQAHKSKLDRAAPGGRVAVNLAGVAVEEVSRGDVVTLPGAIPPAVRLDVRLRAVGGLVAPLTHNMPVTVHTGAAEVAGRLGLLDRPELDALGAGSFQSTSEIASRADLAPDDARRTLDALAAAGRVHRAGTLWCGASYWNDLVARAREALAAHHTRYPLRRGPPAEELRVRLRLSPEAWSAAARALDEEGAVRLLGEVVALAEHEPRFTPAQERAADLVRQTLAAQPYAPPALADLPGVDAELLEALVERGEVVAIADGVHLGRAAYEEMVAAALEAIDAQGSVTVAALRDRFGTSRKYALALLEHLDDERITRRVGDARVRGSRAPRGSGDRRPASWASPT